MSESAPDSPTSEPASGEPTPPPSADTWYKPPSEILWLSGGAKENSSEVSAMCKFARRVQGRYGHADDGGPQQHLVTNSQNHGSFPGITYRARRKVHDGNADVYRNLALTAHMEGLILKADLVVTTAWYAAMLVRALGIERLQYRRRPVLLSAPKIREQNMDDSGLSEDLGYKMFWKAVAQGLIHVQYPDNDHEKSLIAQHYRAHCPKEPLRHVHRLGRSLDLGHWSDEKNGGVCWTGRLNAIKGWQTGLDTLALCDLDGIDTHLFVPQTLNRMKDGPRHLLASGLDHSTALSSREFQEKAGQYSVVVVTSKVEAIGSAYLELAQRGVIPVLRKRPWNETYLGPDWPYRFTRPEQALSMIQEILRDEGRAEAVRAELKDRLLDRYPAPRGADDNTDGAAPHRAVEDATSGRSNVGAHFDQIVDRVWRTYLLSDEEARYGETWREGRIT